MKKARSKKVGWWLMIGAMMIFVQIIIGGITRLTGSGLSITRWDIVTGAIPPLNAHEWQDAFLNYKTTPQYHALNAGMPLKDFKFIYFWEWFHRLWARLIGLVFIIPLFYFIYTKRLRGKWLNRAMLLFALGATVAIFGWFMVLSGLSENLFVSPYRLTLHFSLAILTLCYAWWMGLKFLVKRPKRFRKRSQMRSATRTLIVLVGVQLILGALVSGTHAAMAYPTWPDMNGGFIASELMEPEQWTFYNLIHYNESPFAAALFQLLHRTGAYIIVIMVALFIYRYSRATRDKITRQLVQVALPLVIMVQVSLGISTLVQSMGSIPVGLGVAHQGIGIVTLVLLVTILYRAMPSSREYAKTRVETE